MSIEICAFVRSTRLSLSFGVAKFTIARTESDQLHSAGSVGGSSETNGQKRLLCFVNVAISLSLSFFFQPGSLTRFDLKVRGESVGTAGSAGGAEAAVDRLFRLRASTYTAMLVVVQIFNSLCVV